ncbi:MAG: Txe/YoeB family addiction module toxin [Alphaproteobacteria bacterium]|nr:Txe/YoeB family addiction module toxin [Alphaproteobacteria bacterium]
MQQNSKVNWSEKALQDIKFWEKNVPKIAKRIQQLIDNIQETPYSGLGKPEPLKHNLSKLWSRRIDSQHRLIYFFKEENNLIEIKSCKGHYEKK